MQNQSIPILALSISVVTYRLSVDTPFQKVSELPYLQLMTYKQTVKEQARELETRRQIWRAFFVLTEPIDPESFIVHLKSTGLRVERTQVYNTLTILIDYGFADRNRNDDIEMTFYRCR